MRITAARCAVEPMRRHIRSHLEKSSFQIETDVAAKQTPNHRVTRRGQTESADREENNLTFRCRLWWRFDLQNAPCACRTPQCRSETQGMDSIVIFAGNRVRVSFRSE